MAKALPAGRSAKRRPLFGLFDADGWAWASTKAFFWLLMIIMTLGYIPDRAYYFMVSRTIDLGIVVWSPVNLCPPENGAAMPCPVPAGAVLPWQASVDPALPQPRKGGVGIQLSSNLLYVGGNDGSAPSATTYLSKIDKGTIGAWAEGPALPAARDNAAAAILSGTAYLIGGSGPDGAPTDTVWSLGLDPGHERASAWKKPGDKGVTLPTLPEARSGASAVAVADGIVVAGGRGPDGKPTSTVWKSTVNKAGALGEFKPQPSLTHPVADATLALEGTFLWVYGGSDEAGPTAVVQRADYGAVTAAASAAPGAVRQPRRPRRQQARRRAARSTVSSSGRTRRPCPARGPAARASRQTARCTSSAARTGRPRTASCTGPCPTRPATSPAAGATSRRRTCRPGSSTPRRSSPARRPCCSAGPATAAPSQRSIAPTWRPRSRSSGWASSG